MTDAAPESLRAKATARWREQGERLVADLARDAMQICGRADAAIESLAAAGTALRLVVGGERVHYKRLAHPIAPALNQLVASLPLRHPLHVRRMVVGDGCLWDETVDPAPCASAEEVRRYYQRIGEWLGVCAALGICDLHARNICAHGEHPVLYDVEVIAEGPVSPFDTALLPGWLSTPPGVRAPEVGGLHPGGEVVIDGHARRVEPTWPLLDGVRIPPRDEIDAVLAGLDDAAAVMTSARVAGWRAEADVPRRSPRLYRTILEESLAPDLLRDPDLRRARVARLLGDPQPGEVDALLELEMPTVTRRFTPRPPRIIGRADRSLVRTFLELGSGESTPASGEARDPLDIGDLVLAAAERHGDRLEWTAAIWSPLEGVRRVGRAPMDLLSGQAGFAVVFAALHRASGEARFLEAARACLRGVVASLAADFPFCGALVGLGGRLFALRACARLLDEPKLARVADARFAGIDLEKLAAAAPTDAVAGLAGLRLAQPSSARLAELVEKTPARTRLPGLAGVPPWFRDPDPARWAEPPAIACPDGLDLPMGDGIPVRYSPCAMTGALAAAYAALPGDYPCLVSLGGT